MGRDYEIISKIGGKMKFYIVQYTYELRGIKKYGIKAIKARSKFGAKRRFKKLFEGHYDNYKVNTVVNPRKMIFLVHNREDK